MMSKKKFEILHHECLFQGFFRVDRFHIRQELFQGGWSEAFSRELFSGCERAAEILLFDPHHDKIVLIEQFRVGPMARGDDPFTLEIVAGMVSADETPEETARREAVEETGCKVSEIQKIHAVYPSCGNMSQLTTIFVGRTTAPEEDGLIHGLANEGENIRVRVFDAAQAISLLYTDQLRDASTVIALQWFSLHHTDLRSRWLVSGSSMPII